MPGPGTSKAPGTLSRHPGPGLSWRQPCPVTHNCLGGGYAPTNGGRQPLFVPLTPVDERLGDRHGDHGPAGSTIRSPTSDASSLVGRAFLASPSSLLCGHYREGETSLASRPCSLW